MPFTLQTHGYGCTTSTYRRISHATGHLPRWEDLSLPVEATKKGREEKTRSTQRGGSVSVVWLYTLICFCCCCYCLIAARGAARATRFSPVLSLARLDACTAGSRWLLSVASKFGGVVAFFRVVSVQRCPCVSRPANPSRVLCDCPGCFGKVTTRKIFKLCILSENCTGARVDNIIISKRGIMFVYLRT